MQRRSEENTKEMAYTTIEQIIQDYIDGKLKVYNIYEDKKLVKVGLKKVK